MSFASLSRQAMLRPQLMRPLVRASLFTPSIVLCRSFSAAAAAASTNEANISPAPSFPTSIHYAPDMYFKPKAVPDYPPGPIREAISRVVNKCYRPVEWFMLISFLVILASPVWIPAYMRRRRLAIEKKYEKLRGLID